jgi:hypothetical protein
VYQRRLLDHEQTASCGLCAVMCDAASTPMKRGGALVKNALGQMGAGSRWVIALRPQ